MTIYEQRRVFGFNKGEPRELETGERIRLQHYDNDIDGPVGISNNRVLEVNDVNTVTITETTFYFALPPMLDKIEQQLTGQAINEAEIATSGLIRKSHYYWADTATE